MSLDKKIIKEIERHRKINQYILEQVGAAPEEDVLGALAPVPGAEPAPAPAEAIPPAAPEVGATEPQAIDVESDPDVEKIDDEGESQEGVESGSEELDITELVDSQKNIETKQEEYFIEQQYTVHGYTLMLKLAFHDERTTMIARRLLIALHLLHLST
jgi:hypothetical protein